MYPCATCAHMVFLHAAAGAHNAMEEVLATALRTVSGAMCSCLQDLSEAGALAPTCTVLQRLSHASWKSFPCFSACFKRWTGLHSPPPQLSGSHCDWICHVLVMQLEEAFLGGRRSSLSGCTLRTRRQPAMLHMRGQWRRCSRVREPTARNQSEKGCPCGACLRALQYSYSTSS